MTSKDKVVELIQDKSYDQLTELAKKNKGIFRNMLSLTYDKGEAICWLTIEAIGVVSGRIAVERPEVVRDLIHRLLYSMSDESGGIGWSSPEILGEIVRNSPDLFPDIAPVITSFHDEEMFRCGVFRAIGRIGSVRQDLVKSSTEILLGYLSHPDPSVRGYAVWALGELMAMDALGKLETMMDDNGRFMIYEDGKLSEITVGMAAKEAIKKINRKQLQGLTH